jgi:hypothetical protein
MRAKLNDKHGKNIAMQHLDGVVNFAETHKPWVRANEEDSRMFDIMGQFLPKI